MFFLDVSRADSNVVEDTESHGFVLKGMVAGRAHGAERIGDFLFHDGVNRREHSTGGHQRGFIGPSRYRHVQGIQIPGAPFATLPSALYIFV